MSSTVSIPAACSVSDCGNVDYVVSAAERQHFADHGWVLLRQVMRSDCIDGMREEILTVLRCRNLPDSFLAQAREYLVGGYLDAWVNSRVLAAVAEAFMGPRAHIYLPFTAVKGPGQGQFTFHQDNNYTLLDGPALNCWTALTPMRTENGCLRIVSGSHRNGTVASTTSEVCAGHRRVQETPTEWVDMHMEPGDVCVFDRLTVHGSGPNQTGDPRIGYAVQYHRHDTRALIDNTWALLVDRPRAPVGPVAELSSKAQRGE